MPVNIDRLFNVIAEDSKAIRLRLLVNRFSEHLADMLGYRLKQFPHIHFVFPRILQEVFACDEIPG